MGKRNLAPEDAAAREFVEQLRLRDIIEPIDEIARRHGVLLSELRGPSRARHVAAARRLVWLYMHDDLGWSYPSIGRLFGRDSTTVMVARNLRRRGQSAAFQQVSNNHCTASPEKRCLSNLYTGSASCHTAPCGPVRRIATLPPANDDAMAIVG